MSNINPAPMVNFFAKFPELVAVISEKQDGSMKIVEDEIIWRQNLENRKTFFGKVGIENDSVVGAGLVHGDKVEIVSGAEQEIIPKTDSLVTKEKGVYLAITVADCVPIFFYEKEKGIVGLAHAGWKGIVGDLIGNTLEKISELGGKVDDLHVALGPGINECHFEIKEDILEQFSKYPEFVIRKDGKIFVDLKGIILQKMIAVGIAAGNIENNSTCTHCSENLFSYRRDKPKIVEAMVALIGIKI